MSDQVVEVFITNAQHIPVATAVRTWTISG